MEFTSEDLYGGYIDPVSAFVPNYGLLMSGMPITAQTILGDTAASGLMQTLNTLNDPETQAYYQSFIDSQSSTPQQGSVTTEDVYGVVNPPDLTYAGDLLNPFDPVAQLDPAEEMDYFEDLVDEVIFGDPGAIEDTTRSPVETIFNDDGTITTVIDPTLVTLPPLLGDPVIEDVEGGGGATASPETETEQTIPDYSDLVNPEFEVPEAPEGVTGIPEFYRVDEEGNVTVILDPDNPILIPPERVPGHVDTTTPGTYPESGGVIDEQEETTTPTTSGPSIVITTPPSVSRPATPSDTADTGTDQAGQEGQQGTDTGGTGGGSAGSGGDGTGDGDGSGDGGMLSRTAKSKDYFDSIEYQPVAVPNLILPNQPINTSIVPVRSQRDSFMDSSIVASMFKDLI